MSILIKAAIIAIISPNGVLFTKKGISTVTVSATVTMNSCTGVGSIDKYMQIIRDTSYIQRCKINNKKDIHSITYLIDKTLSKKMSQSDSIKLGNGIENFFRNMIIKSGGSSGLRDIREIKTKKGEKEMDHLFEDTTKKIIYYAELKSCLNLDTEKCKSTYMKCLENEQKLRVIYPEHEIQMFLVGNRYLETSDLKEYTKIIKKYNPIYKNLCGVNDYFRNIGIPHMCFEDENQYRYVLNTIVKEMFKYGDVDDDK